MNKFFNVLDNTKPHNYVTFIPIIKIFFYLYLTSAAYKLCTLLYPRMSHTQMARASALYSDLVWMDPGSNPNHM